MGTLVISQSVGLKKLNLVQCVTHSKLFSAKNPDAFCVKCGPTSLAAVQVAKRTMGLPAPEQVSNNLTMPAPCRHSVVRLGKGDCKKCDHAEKERARRSQSKPQVDNRAPKELRDLLSI